METEADQCALDPALAFLNECVFEPTLAFLDDYEADLELNGGVYVAIPVATSQHGTTSSEASQSETDADDLEASNGSTPQRNRMPAKTAVVTAIAEDGASKWTRKEEGTELNMEEQLHVTEADQRAFDATVAFLDEYDADLELRGGGDTASRLSTPQHGAMSSQASQSANDADDAVTSSGAKPQRNRMLVKKTTVKTTADGGVSKRSRKEELLYLRSTVEKLEEQLRVLKRDEDVFRDAPTTTTTFTVPSQGSSMWEDVAMLQFEQRKDSEAENMRLRGLLKSQIKLANGLERLLKRSNVDLLLPQNQLKRSRYSSALDPSNDAYVFDELMTINDEMYLTLEEQFTHPHFDREDIHLQEVDVDHDIRSGAVVDVYEGHNLPFDLHTTADAVWRCIGRLSQDMETEHFGRETTSDLNSVISKLTETTDDLIKRHFHFTVHANRHEAIFRGRVVARRYFEDNRIVIIWNALIEPEMPGGGNEGMLVRQKGWTVIKRPKHLPPQGGAEEVAARVQTKYVLTPYVYDDVPNSQRKAGTLTNFVLESVRSHLERSRKMTENVLIQDVVNKS